MLRRNVRLRKEYLYRKSVEERDRLIVSRKRELRDVVESDKTLPPELRDDFKRLRTSLDLDDTRTEVIVQNSRDDEYAFAGVKDPSLLITTSRSPSNRLTQFAKELSILIPNAHRMNRGGYQLNDIVSLAHRNELSDVIIVHEQKGEPDGMIVSHLPHGPTAYFSISEVVLRQDLSERIGTMSECAPHLIFHQFSSQLGQRVQSVLKCLFPPAPPRGERVVAFINYGDLIFFRNYTSKMANAARNEKPREQDVELTEQGPRFTLRLYRMDFGTVEMKNAEVQWSLRSFINRPKAALVEA